MEKLFETTIVMVDDNLDEIFLTRRQARRDGIINRFVSEKRPEQLFATLENLMNSGVGKESFVVLVDINMPRMNGFELLRSIRTSEKFRDVPVFMLTASCDDADRLEAEELGCDGYLAKPFAAEHFFAELKRVPRVKTQLFCANALPTKADGAVQLPEAA